MRPLQCMHSDTQREALRNTRRASLFLSFFLSFFFWGGEVSSSFFKSLRASIDKVRGRKEFLVRMSARGCQPVVGPSVLPFDISFPPPLLSPISLSLARSFCLSVGSSVFFLLPLSFFLLSGAVGRRREERRGKGGHRGNKPR